METRVLDEVSLVNTKFPSRKLPKKNFCWRLDTASKIKFLKRLKLKKKKDQPMVMLERLEHRLSVHFVKELYKNKSLRVLQDSRPKPRRKKELFQIVDKETYEAKLRSSSLTPITRRSKYLANKNKSKEMVGDDTSPKCKSQSNIRNNSKEAKESSDLLSTKISTPENDDDSTPNASTSHDDNSSSNEPSISHSKSIKNINKNKVRQKEIKREVSFPKGEKSSAEYINKTNVTKMKLMKSKVCNTSSKGNTAISGSKHSNTVEANKGDKSSALELSNCKNYAQALTSPSSNPSPDSSSSTIETNKRSSTPDEFSRCSADNNDLLNCDSTMQEVLPNSSNAINNASFKDFPHKKKSDSSEDSGIPKIVLYLRGDGPDKQYRCNIGKLNDPENKKSQSDKLDQRQSNSRYTENKREVDIFGENSNDEENINYNDDAQAQAEPLQTSDIAIFSELEEYKKSKILSYNSRSESVASEKESPRRIRCRSDSLPELETIGDDEASTKESMTEEENCQVAWFPTEELSSSKKGPKITLSYKNTGKPTAHVEPYIAESSLRQCSRKGRGFYDENIPFLDSEDLDISYENQILSEGKQNANSLDNLMECRTKNGAVFEGDRRHPTSNQRSDYYKYEDDENDYESQSVANSSNKTRNGKYDVVRRSSSKFLSGRNVIASYCTQIVQGKNASSNGDQHSRQESSRGGITQLKRSSLGGSTYTYFAKTTGDVARSRQRRLSIDSTLSLFKVRIDYSSINLSSRGSISLPNLNILNDGHAYIRNNDRWADQDNGMFRRSNNGPIIHSSKTLNYADEPNFNDSNCSGNVVADSHTSDNQTSGSNLSDSDTSSEISEDSTGEHNGVRFMGLYDSRTISNTMLGEGETDHSDRSVPFDPQYEAVWGERAKKHRMKLERRLMKIRAFKRSRDEKLNSLNKSAEGEIEKLGKIIKETRKRSRDEGNGCDGLALNKQLRKFHEGDRGRRLAQEIPGFNWLEEKIRNTSTISSPTVSTSTSLAEETRGSSKQLLRSPSCPTTTPKPLPALIPSNEFISSAGGAPSEIHKLLTESSKGHRRQSSSSEKEDPCNKSSDSVNERSLVRDEDVSGNHKALMSSSRDSTHGKSNSKSIIEPYCEKMASNKRHLVESEGHSKNKDDINRDNHQGLAPQASNHSRDKKWMEPQSHGDKEASSEVLTATSPKRFHIQTAAPPLVQTSKVTALPKRQLMSPPQQSSSGDSYIPSTQSYKNQKDSPHTNFRGEPISPSVAKYCSSSPQNNAKPRIGQSSSNSHRVQSPHDSLSFYDKDAYNPPSRSRLSSEVLPKFSFQSNHSPAQDNNPSSKSVSANLKHQISAVNSKSYEKTSSSDLKYSKNPTVQRCSSPPALEVKEPIKALAQRNFDNSSPHLKHNTKNNYLIPLNKIKIESRNLPHDDSTLNDFKKIEATDIPEMQRLSPKSSTPEARKDDTVKQRASPDESKNTSLMDCEDSGEMIIDTGDDQDNNTCSSESSPQNISVSQKLSILTRAFKSKLNNSLGLSPEDAESQNEQEIQPSNEARESTAQPNPNAEKTGDSSILSPPEAEPIEKLESIDEIPRRPPSEEHQNPKDDPSIKSELDSKEEKPVLISIPETLPSFATVLNGMKMTDSFQQNIFGKETKKEVEVPNSLIVALYEELMRTRQEVEKLRKVQEQMLNADKFENRYKHSEQPKPNTSANSEETPPRDIVRESAPAPTLPPTLPPTPTPVVIDITNIEDNQEASRAQKEDEMTKKQMMTKMEQELKFVYEVNNERLKRPLQHVEQPMTEIKRRKSDDEPMVNSSQDNTITIRYNIPDSVPIVPKQNQKPTDNIKLRNLLGISNNELDVVPVEESVTTKQYNDSLLQNREHSLHRVPKQQEIYSSANHERGRDLYSKLMESQASPKTQTRHSLPELPNLIPSSYPAPNVRQHSEPSMDQQREAHLLSMQMAQHSSSSRPMVKSSQSHQRPLGSPYEETRIYNPSDNTYHINGTKLDVISVSEPQPLMSHHSIPIMSQSQGNYGNESEPRQIKYQHPHDGGHKGIIPQFARSMEAVQNSINSSDSLPSGLPKFQPKIIIPQSSTDPPNSSTAEWHHPQPTLQESRHSISSQAQMLPPTSSAYAQKPPRMSAFSNPNYVYGNPNGAQLAHVFPVNTKPSSSPPDKQQKLYNTLHQMQQESSHQGQSVMTSSNIRSSNSSTHIPSSSPLRYTSQGYHPSQHQMQQSSGHHSMPIHTSQGLNQQQLNSSYQAAAQHRQIAVTRSSAIQEVLQKSYQPVMSNQMIQQRPPHPSNMVHSSSQMHPVYVSPHTNMTHRQPNVNRISPHRLSPQQSQQQQSRGPGPGIPQTPQVHHTNQQVRIPTQYHIPPSQSTSAVPHQFKPIQPRILPPPPYPHGITPNQTLQKVHISENMLARNQVQQMELEKANNEAIEQANLKKAGSPNASSKKKCLICPQTAQFLCSGCKTAWYCSKECQREHWGLHSPNCIGRK